MEKSPSKILASYLLEIKAIKLQAKDPFTWASGLRSPIYCDNRITLSYPKIRKFIKQELQSASQNFEDFDIVAGVATAGIPHGMMLADVLEKPFAYVRSSAKAHGRQNKIEGRILPNQKVLVVEDLISTGKSSLAAVDALREIPCDIVGTLALFSYGLEESAQRFEAAKVPLITLSGYESLLETAEETNYITTEEKELLKSWKANPKEWYQQNFKA